MGLKIFHTADVHIGLKFGSRGYEPDVRQRLVAARQEVVERMVSLANDRGCDLLVVAGDLFDNPRVAKRDLKEAAAALSRFEGVVALLPGNHDYLQRGEDPIWDSFRDVAGDRVLVLTAPEPLDLRPFDLDAAIYPGPCSAKHLVTNAIGWIGPGTKLEGVRFHLGLAHGSLEALSPDFNQEYYPMSRRELDDKAMDAWLLGHTHVRHPDTDGGSEERVFFPSTPEPDGFDCRHPGHAWIIELEESGAIRYKSVTTGTFRFHEIEREISAEMDVEQLRELFVAMDPRRDLVKLALRGKVPAEIYEERQVVIDELRGRVLYLEADLSEVMQKITQKEIDAEFSEGSFPHRVLSSLALEPRDSLALQLAYELIQEARR